MPNRIAGVALLMVLSAAGAADAQFAGAQPVPGENFRLELAAMFWSPTPDLRVQTGVLAGEDPVDFVQEFGLEEDRFREFRLVLKAARKHKIRFSYLPVNYQADTTLQRTIAFGDHVFEANLPASAHIDWDMWRFGYEWDFAAADRALLGLVAEVKYNRVAASIDSAVGAVATETRVPVPSLGIIGRGYLHRNVALTIEFTGFKLPGRLRSLFTDSELEGTMRDFDIYATVSLSRFLGVQGGYRRLTTDFALEEDAAELRLRGTYFGAMLRF